MEKKKEVPKGNLAHEESKIDSELERNTKEKNQKEGNFHNFRFLHFLFSFFSFHKRLNCK